MRETGGVGHHAAHCRFDCVFVKRETPMVPRERLDDGCSSWVYGARHLLGDLPGEGLLTLACRQGSGPVVVHM